jgi:hypothetical protein
VSVYEDLLRAALADPSSLTVADLVADLGAKRKRLGTGYNAVTRLADALAYDVALVRLCERLNVGVELPADAGSGTRRRLEALLLDRFPTICGVLDDEHTNDERTGEDSHG